jgi:RIO-like serine/threonine protein kinase
MKIKRFIEQTEYLIQSENGGVYGRIFKISEEYCAKALHFHGEILCGEREIQNLNKEFKIMNRLYQGKISVPKPVGVFNICLPEVSTKVPGLVMEYIEDGIYPWKLKNIINKLDFLTLKELQKAMRLGYIPGHDCYTYSNNVLWSERRQNIVLIDFGDWVKENSKYF